MGGIRHLPDGEPAFSVDGVLTRYDAQGRRTHLVETVGDCEKLSKIPGRDLVLFNLGVAGRAELRRTSDLTLVRSFASPKPQLTRSAAVFAATPAPAGRHVIFVEGYTREWRMNGVLRVWTLAGVEVQNVILGDSPPTSVAVSPDGRTVAVGFWESTRVRLWRVGP